MFTTPATAIEAMFDLPPSPPLVEAEVKITVYRLQKWNPSSKEGMGRKEKRKAGLDKTITQQVVAECALESNATTIAKLLLYSVQNSPYILQQNWNHF